MKTRVIIPLLLLLIILSCKFSKSTGKDFQSGLTIKGDGLTCEEVFLSDGTVRITRNSFTYGETFYLNFDDITGFVKEGENVYPGMQLFVISQSDDTVMSENDMYIDYTEGINISPLALNANITVADPIHSGNSFTLQVHIWDKKGEGTYDALFHFDVVPDGNIQVESNRVGYGEIYLYSQAAQEAITSGAVPLNETIYLIIEGLTGFTMKEGKANAGLSMKISDSAGTLLLSEDDLLADSQLDYSDLTTRIAPNFILTGTDIQSPVICEIVVWDKNGDGSIRTLMELDIE